MRLLVAVPDAQAAQEICLQMEEQMWDTAWISDGRKILSQLGSADMLLLHECLAGIDGLTAGYAIASSKPTCPPLILLICADPSARPFWADCAASIGVSSARLCQLLCVLAQKPLPNLAAACLDEINLAVERFLFEIGMDSSLNGCAYTAWMLQRLIPSPAASAMPVGDLYAACARAFGKSAASVERSLRVAVENLFTHGSMTGIERYFGATVDSERGKLTNRAFLLQAAQQLRYSLTAARSPNSSEMHHRPAAPTSV